MERCEIKVRGIVQGVGFRPFVYRLASDLDLSGVVRNRSGEVLIEVEGESASLNQFASAVENHPPPLAQIESISRRPRQPRGGRLFRIGRSEPDRDGQVFVSPDAATCDECLAEMLNPADRRHGYAFLNCTNCGPRLTIIQSAPYDRPRTTMAGFAMCEACRAEYENPRDRRFHAQPTACPKCGPRLALSDPAGTAIPNVDPIAAFALAMRSGQIGALKGLGGYYLVCSAADETTVAELRRRKHRDEKPLAVMLPDLHAVESLCEVRPEERVLLTSWRTPIVLLRKRSDSRQRLAEGVAPGNPFLGVMLPYTPLHHLLLRAAEGTPLVMTSGNRSDEPIAIQDDDARRRLGDIADVFLTHDRPIQVRCDDSVTRIVDGIELPLRRSRGYAPRPVTLPFACPESLLAVGGQLKDTFALGAGRQAFLSQHLGDLDHYDAYRAFVQDIALYEQLFEIHPAGIAHDLHPDYASTHYAIEQARANHLRLIPVQHHHAHMASCMAEHGLTGAVIGVTFDGTGYGTDAAIWGGEFLVGDYAQFQRAAHLRYIGMPGGDRAIREPWRMAVAHLLDANCEAAPLESRIPPAQRRIVQRMLERRLNTPWTSSAGRLFDAVASLAGLRDRVSYEGQAAMMLEWLATEIPADANEPGYAFEFQETAPGTPLIADTRPVIRAVAADANRATPPQVIARRFHSAMVDLIATTCRRVRTTTQLNRVVLSGGVFMNALLTSESCLRLRDDGFEVYRHHLVPPNDGGLSLGQLAIAAQRTSPSASASAA